MLESFTEDDVHKGAMALMVESHRHSTRYRQEYWGQGPSPAEVHTRFYEDTRECLRQDYINESRAVLVAVLGAPRKPWWEINWFVRMLNRLRRRSRVTDWKGI